MKHPIKSNTPTVEAKTQLSIDQWQGILDNHNQFVSEQHYAWDKPISERFSVVDKLDYFFRASIHSFLDFPEDKQKQFWRAEFKKGNVLKLDNTIDTANTFEVEDYYDVILKKLTTNQPEQFLRNFISLKNQIIISPVRAYESFLLEIEAKQDEDGIMEQGWMERFLKILPSDEFIEIENFIFTAMEMKDKNFIAGKLIHNKLEEILLPRREQRVLSANVDDSKSNSKVKVF